MTPRCHRCLEKNWPITALAASGSGIVLRHRGRTLLWPLSAQYAPKKPTFYLHLHEVTNSFSPKSSKLPTSNSKKISILLPCTECKTHSGQGRQPTAMKMEFGDEKSKNLSAVVRPGRFGGIGRGEGECVDEEEGNEEEEAGGGAAAEIGTDGTQTLRQSSWCWAAWSCQRSAASGPDWLTHGECAPHWTGRSSATAGRSPCRHLQGSGWLQEGGGLRVGVTNMLASKGQQRRSSSVFHLKDKQC